LDEQATNEALNCISIYDLIPQTPGIVTISVLIFTVAELFGNGSISPFVL
jgi:hypothetical protein